MSRDRLEASALTACGPFRDNNEDFVLARADLGIFVVADGVGGRPRGERAATLTAAVFERTLRAKPSRARLLGAFRTANNALFEESAALGLRAPMAAVATVAWIDTASANGTLLIGHIGDTRAHVFDADGAGCQITHDQGAIDADAVPESETLAAPGRNVVASALGLELWSGGDWGARVEIRKLILEPGQALVLVSDGVSDYLDRARTAAVVAEHGRSAEALARALVSAAVEAQARAGAGDNVGVVVVRRPGSAKRLRRASGSRKPIAAALALGTGVGLLAAEVIHASAAVRELPMAEETVAAAGPVKISLGPGARVKIGESAIVLEGADVRIDLGDAICVPAEERDRGGTR